MREQTVNVLTFHGDNARLGWNAKETLLTPESVVPETFGKLWETPLDAVVNSSPLTKDGVIFAATNLNSVYALRGTDGKILWVTKNISPTLTGGQFNGDWRNKERNGILSTPVIDSAMGAIYVCLPRARGLRQTYEVWALDIRTGKPLLGWPVTLDGSYKNARFTPGQLMQRGALLIHDGWLYIPFGGRGDVPPWRGWVMGVNLKQPKQKQRCFCASTSTDGAGIWSAGGLSVSKEGEFFAVTGNGDYDFPQGDNLAQTVLRLRADAKNGLVFSRQTRDFYTPENHLFLDEQDEDLGGATALVLPRLPGTSTPNVIFTGGKDGCAYLLNRDNLGGVGRELQKERLFTDPKATYHEGIRATCAYFDAGPAGRFLFVPGDNPGPDKNLGLVALKLAPEKPGGPLRFSKVWTLPKQLNRPSSPVVSSNGASAGLVWVFEPEGDDGQQSVLHVYDALTGKETYHSELNPKQDRLSGGRKFVSATVANGRVFIGVKGVACYGRKDTNS